ncbi:MAG: N-6 DNA methylase, partial [Campylobacterales bacterium]|nr:N-6 DNA methylase [Campylobacterales bacterium]
HFNSGKQEDLTLTTAIDYIPKTIPVLHDLYELAIKLSRELPDIKASVELILRELNSCAIEKIRNSFYNDTSAQEPILYFYETFLREYDKETKKKRGAYYTPKPVVDFIVRSIDTILTEDFALKEGFLNKEVKVLDPATGTGTFLASTIELVKEKIDGKYQILGLEKEQFIKEVSDHILHNFYAFEFMVAPYTVAHLKLTLLLKTLGFDFAMTANDGDSDNDRLKIYLANTLDDPSKEPNNLFGFSNIADESRKAKAVKNQHDIIAIIGNPPYSGSSQNPSREGKNLTWIGEQIEYYKYFEGKKLDEKNPKWLQDDYVKFIRFAQYQIESAGFGTVGYIVPHGFLDNPTFRYMRKSLMKSFSKIYLLDLHGNDNKKETDRQGNKDENVFDIKQGVCIALFVKEKKAKACKVYHGDLYGKREEKFATLQTQTFKELCNTKLNPSGEMCYFIPRSEDSEYMEFWSVKDIFRVSSVGIVTGKDKLLINTDKNQLILNLKKENIETDETLIQKIAYRPFDTQYIYYDDTLVERSRKNVMKHMLKDNLALICNRQINDTFEHIFVAKNITESSVISNKTREINYSFPLYLYNEDKTSLLDDEKITNFTEEFVKFRHESLKNFSDEQIFYYIYGLLYSPTYRTRYNEFLKTDFPRIDFGYDIAQIAKYGKELTELHLLTHDIFEEQNKWGLRVEGKEYGVSYAKKSDMYREGKIYLNPNTYINGADENTWKFMIGGYQVLEKWLNDRKNTTLGIDELLHYMKIIVSLKETQKIMKHIDEVVNRMLPSISIKI